MSNTRPIIRHIVSKSAILLSFFIITFIFAVTFSNSSDVSINGCNLSFIEDNDSVSQVKIRTDGTATIDKKPFFPFGLYHVSWESTADERLDYLRESAAAKFNIVHVSFKRFEQLEDYENFLDEAEHLGVFVVTEFGEAPTINPLIVVNKFKDKPAVFGWNIGDDVDEFQNEVAPGKLLELHCQVKNIDPYHITYISGNKYKLSDYVNSADAIGIQAYPVGDEPKKPLSWVHHIISKIAAPIPENRLIIANAQAFRIDREGASIPTKEQVRNMTYQALLAGAKGIIYYTYHDDQWHLPKHPNLWKGIQSLVPEIKQISPILLEGNLKKIDTKVKDVLSGVWTLQDRGLAIVINTSPDKSRAISLDLSTDQARAIFPNRFDSLKIDNGKLSGILAPLDVSIYSFNYKRN